MILLDCCFFIFLYYHFCQVDAQLQVVRKLEEKERLLQGTISTAERELGLRTQALDMNKRKVKNNYVVMRTDPKQVTTPCDTYVPKVLHLMRSGIPK